MAPSKRVAGPGLPARAVEPKLDRRAPSGDGRGEPLFPRRPQLERHETGRTPDGVATCVSVNLQEPTHSVKCQSASIFCGPSAKDAKGKLERTDRVVEEEGTGELSGAELEHDNSLVHSPEREMDSKAPDDGEWNTQGFGQVMSGPIPALRDGVEWLTGFGEMIVRELERGGNVRFPPINRSHIREIVLSGLLRKPLAMRAHSGVEEVSGPAKALSRSGEPQDIRDRRDGAKVLGRTKRRKPLAEYSDSELTDLFKEAGNISALGRKLHYCPAAVRKELQRRGLREHGARTR